MKLTWIIGILFIIIVVTSVSFYFMKGQSPEGSEVAYATESEILMENYESEASVELRVVSGTSSRERLCLLLINNTEYSFLYG